MFKDTVLSCPLAVPLIYRVGGLWCWVLLFADVFSWSR